MVLRVAALAFLLAMGLGSPLHAEMAATIPPPTETVAGVDVAPSPSRDAVALRGTRLDSHSLLDDFDAAALFLDLFRKGGYGANDLERAAFLVRDERGGWGCLLWPRTGRFRSEAFRGLVPEGTVAIIHTHPNQIASASANDMRQAVNTGLPLYTITWGAITVVDPATGKEHFVRRRNDWKKVIPVSHQKKATCRELGTPDPKPFPGLVAGSAD